MDSRIYFADPEEAENFEIGLKKTFSNARKNNQATFIYKGKLYSTRLDD